MGRDARFVFLEEKKDFKEPESDKKRKKVASHIKRNVPNFDFGDKLEVYIYGGIIRRQI